jgi:hypothetical protein
VKRYNAQVRMKLCVKRYISWGRMKLSSLFGYASKNKSITGEIYSSYFKLKMFLSTTFKMDVLPGSGSSLSVEIMEGMPLVVLIN